MPASPLSPPSATRTRFAPRALLASAAAGITALALLAIGGVPAHAAPAHYTELTSFTETGARLTGMSVDLDGDYAIFSGALRTTADSTVTVMHRTGPGADDWDKAVLTAPAGVTHFGYGVGIDVAAGRAVVSARGTAAVFVYTLIGDNQWSEPEVIAIPSPLPGSSLGGVGERLSLDGDTVVVAAPNATVGGASNAGAVYVVDLETRQVQTLTAATPTAQGIFGQSLELDDGTLAVGELQIQGTHPSWGATVFRLGRVHVFDLAADATDMVIDYPLTDYTYPAGAHSTVPFGVSLALAEGRLYVGSADEVNFTSDDPDDPVGGVNDSSVQSGTSTQGAVYVFDAATGAQIGGKLIAPAHSYGFGAEVGSNGDALLASAYNLDPAEYGKGEVYVYDAGDLAAGVPDDAAFGRQFLDPVQKLRPVATPDSSRFGSGLTGEGGISLSGATAVIGSPRMGASGTVTIFEPIIPNVAERVVTVTPSTVVYGQAGTLIATTDVGGADGGQMVFTIDGTDSTPVTVVDHAARLELPAASRAVGSYPVTVTFTPTDGVPVTAASTATVTAATTVTSVDVANGAATDPAVTSPLTDGTTWPVSGAVTAQFGTVPTGSVEIWRDGVLEVSTPLDAAGAYSVDLASFDGQATIEARYVGDANHLPSQASAQALVDPTPEPTERPTTTGPTVTDPNTTDPATASPAAGDGGEGLAMSGATVAAVAILAGLLLTAGALLRRRRA